MLADCVVADCVLAACVLADCVLADCVLAACVLAACVLADCMLADVPGKSSLLMALTGLVPPPLRLGEILVDEQEISTIPLLEHRGSIAVIPQAL